MPGKGEFQHLVLIQRAYSAMSLKTWRGEGAFLVVAVSFVGPEMVHRLHNQSWRPCFMNEYSSSCRWGCVCLSVIACKFFLVEEVPSRPHSGWLSLCLDSQPQPHLDLSREGTSLSVLEAFFVAMGFWSGLVLSGGQGQEGEGFLTVIIAQLMTTVLAHQTATGKRFLLSCQRPGQSVYNNHHYNSSRSE